MQTKTQTDIKTNAESATAGTRPRLTLRVGQGEWGHADGALPRTWVLTGDEAACTFHLAEIPERVVRETLAAKGVDMERVSITSRPVEDAGHPTGQGEH